MEFSNIVSKYGLVQEMDRKCKSNADNYPLQDKAARLNDSLDRYLYLAFQADKRWNFDDINESSPPIDSQNIVSGTNRYKFSAFTEKIINLIRLEILDSNGKGLFLYPETINSFGFIESKNQTGRLNGASGDTFQALYIDAPAGTPTHYIKYGDFTYLRPNPNYSESKALLAYFNRPASKFNFIRFTVTQASPAVFTSVAHGFALNDTIVFETTGALLTGLVVGTTYYIITAGLTSDAFEVSATLGGSAVNTTGTQSGVHSFIKTNKSPGIPEIHHPYLARHASLPFLIEKGLPSVNQIKKLIGSGNPRDPFYGGDELAIDEHFSQRDKDVPKRIIPFIESNK